MSNRNRQAKNGATHRVLVIANETLVTDTAADLIEHAAAQADVLVVAPALTGRLAFWTSDDGRARRDAAERLDRCLGGLQRKGIRAAGSIGDANPVLALDDALRSFPADEIVVVTHPERRSNWLAHDIVERVRERSGRPVRHIVADTALGLEYLAVA